MEHYSTPRNPDENKKILSWKDHAIALWALLDDIDTIDDIAKENETMYRNLTRTTHRKRFNHATSDGYNLEFNIEKERSMTHLIL